MALYMSNFIAIILISIVKLSQVSCLTQRQQLCYENLKTYCDSESPNVIDCGRSEIINWTRDTGTIGYVTIYRNKILKNLAPGAIKSPQEFCDSDESNQCVEDCNTPEHPCPDLPDLDFKNLDKETLKAICNTQLVDFGTDLSNVFHYAVYNTSVWNNKREKRRFAAHYLFYIASLITFKKSLLDPAQFCEKKFPTQLQ